MVKVSDTGTSDFKIIPEGTHVAVCNMVADLGWQETPFGTKHQVLLRWETPEEKTDTGPMVIYNTYTASLNEKARLRQDLENWRGRSFTNEELAEFDLQNVLGKPCQITVRHKEKGDRTYANVTGVTSLPKGMSAPEAQNELIIYGEGNEGNWDKLPEWVQNKIRNQAGDEPPVPEPTGPDVGADDSDVPF